jgi:hypothetical protein
MINLKELYDRNQNRELTTNLQAICALIKGKPHKSRLPINYQAFDAFHLQLTNGRSAINGETDYNGHFCLHS